jgi:hypothetical protein
MRHKTKGLGPQNGSALRLGIGTKMAASAIGVA